MANVQKSADQTIDLYQLFWRQLTQKILLNEFFKLESLVKK
jgi:hypothetical protein